MVLATRTSYRELRILRPASLVEERSLWNSTDDITSLLPLRARPQKSAV